MLKNIALSIPIFFKTIFFYLFFRLKTFNQIIKKLDNYNKKDSLFAINPIKRVILIRFILKYLLLSTNCFHRAFISALILRDCGIDAEFVIGVSLNDSFDSHAWVENKGKPILEKFMPEEYKIIYRI